MSEAGVDHYAHALYQRFSLKLDGFVVHGVSVYDQLEHPYRRSRFKGGLESPYVASLRSSRVHALLNSLNLI